MYADGSVCILDVIHEERVPDGLSKRVTLLACNSEAMSATSSFSTLLRVNSCVSGSLSPTEVGFTLHRPSLSACKQCIHLLQAAYRMSGEWLVYRTTTRRWINSRLSEI